MPLIQMPNDEASEFDWEIYYHLDDLEDEIQQIFRRCERDIHISYTPVKSTLYKWKEEEREKRIFASVDAELKTCTWIWKQSDDYRTLLTFILDTVYHGKSEGFGDWLLDIKDRDMWCVIVLTYINAQMIPFEELVKIYNDQLCEAYR